MFVCFSVFFRLSCISDFSYPNLLYKNVVVFPSRAVAIENVLRLFSPRLAIVDEHLTRHLPRQWLTSLELEVCLAHLPSSGYLFILKNVIAELFQILLIT